MKTHEEHCCGNPDRICRMCHRLVLAQPESGALVNALDNDGLEGLRVLADGCPACVLAGIMQWRKSPSYDPDYEGFLTAHFDFKKEMSDAFQRAHEIEMESGWRPGF